MDTLATDPWNALPTDFPEPGTLAQKLEFCLRFAVLAPSSHNSQPWRFAVREGAVDVYADRERALPVVDPEDRELTLSCGAAIETLHVAMTYFGLRGDVRELPEPGNRDHLARIAVEGTSAIGGDAALFEAIPKRHTTRVAYGERQVPRDAIVALEAELMDDGVWFHKVPSLDDRLAIADLVDKGDRAQMKDERFRRELASWVRANGATTVDGLPGHAIGLGDFASTVGPFVLRTFDLGNRQAAKDRALALESPLLGVIGTDDDGARAWVGAGRALARVLLRATSLGLCASFLNQPIEVPSLRPKVAEAIGRTGFPQLLLRFGSAEPARPTPRRPLEAVLMR